MRRVKNWKRAGVTLAVMLIACVAVIVVGSVVRQVVARQTLAGRVAELDRAEPGWDLESRAAALNEAATPLDGNAAVTVRDAGSVLAKLNLPDWPEGRAANRRTPDEEAAQLDSALATAKPALASLRAILDQDRAALPVAGDPVSGVIRDIAPSRAAAHACRLAAARAAETDDAPAAARFTRVAAALPRAAGPQLSAMGELVRCASVNSAATTAERVMALAALPDADLAKSQADFGAISRTNFLEQMVAAERAYAFANCEQQAAAAPGLLGLGVRRHYHAAQALLLDADAELIAAARRPLAGQRAAADATLARFQAIAAGSADLLLARGALDARAKLVPAALRARGQAGLAVAAIACERFRLRTGHWPASLADIPKDLLAEVPTDPFTGRPIAYEATADGVTLTIDGPTPVTFRLYDPAKRNQP